MRMDHLGAGWAFPPQVNSRGEIALAYGERDIEQAIRIILGTAKGERPMRPEFGSNLHTLVFAPNNTSTATTVAYYVEEALARWEPRIDVVDVDVSSEGRDDGVMHVAVRYKVRATNDERNLVYPFYRIPPEE